MKHTIIALFAIAGATALAADMDDRTTESRVFPNAHLVILDNVNGSIEVTGSGGSEVRMELAKHIRAESQERLEAARREVKLDVQQSGDTLKLYVDGPFRCNNCCDHSCNGSRHQGYDVNYDFKLTVPASTRLDLYTVNGGHIDVHGVTGDFDVRNVNGRIDMTDVGGSGKAHTVNGPVKATFVRNPAGDTSFETINGSVDVSFRPGLSANVRLQTMHGGMFTDYEVSTLPPQQDADSERHGSKLVIRRGGATGVKIGNGGPEVRLKTINGDLFVRESK
ncbi:MAG: hypothetical protein JO022_17555 [Acidobacteriaceae bacterium]|nr:hypothetical protein [Acidobacteriaceae bacterium]